MRRGTAGIGVPSPLRGEGQGEGAPDLSEGASPVTLFLQSRFARQEKQPPPLRVEGAPTIRGIRTTMTTLLIAEHDNASLKEPTARALTAAAQLGGEVHVLVAGKDCGPAAEAAAKLAGVAKVLKADADALAHGLAEPVAALIVSLAGPYDALVAPATNGGKNVMPRVAALLDVMQVSEIIRIVSPDTFERPIYAGNAVETVQSTDAKKVITVRAAAFKARARAARRRSRPSRYRPLPTSPPSPAPSWRNRTGRSSPPPASSSRAAAPSPRPRTSRNTSSPSPTSSARPSAPRAPPSMPAMRRTTSRSARPARWSPPTSTSPAEISGAIQHLAGMKDAKIIVAINKDADAPIFQVADFGLVGDLFQILPELDQALAART